MAKKPIYKGNTINNFGRHFPVPFIEKIEIFDVDTESYGMMTKLRLHASLLFNTDETFPIERYAQMLLKDMYLTTIVTDQTSIINSLLIDRKNLKAALTTIYGTMSQTDLFILGDSTQDLQITIAKDLNPDDSVNYVTKASNSVFVSRALSPGRDLMPFVDGVFDDGAYVRGGAIDLSFTGEYDENNNRVMKSSAIGIDLLISPALGDISDLGIFIGLSAANPGITYGEQEDVMFALSYGDLAFEWIKKGGRLANRDKIGYFKENDEFYNDLAMVSLNGRHYTTEFINQGQIAEQMEILSTEFRDASIADGDLKTVIDNIAFIGVEYGNTPNYLLELNAYRKNIANQDATTPAGKFYRAFSMYLSNANAALVNDEERLLKKMVQTSKLRDYRPSQNLEPLTATYAEGLPDYEVIYPAVIQTNLSKYIIAQDEDDASEDYEAIFTPESSYTEAEMYNTYRTAIRTKLQRFSSGGEEYNTQRTVTTSDFMQSRIEASEISMGMDNVFSWLSALYNLEGTQIEGGGTNWASDDATMTAGEVTTTTNDAFLLYQINAAETRSDLAGGTGVNGLIYTVAARFAAAVSLFQQWAAGTNTAGIFGTESATGDYEEDTSNKLYLGGFAKGDGFFRTAQEANTDNWDPDHGDEAMEQYFLITNGQVWDTNENNILHGQHNIHAFMSAFKLFGYHGNPLAGSCTLEFGVQNGEDSGGGQWNCAYPDTDNDGVANDGAAGDTAQDREIRISQELILGDSVLVETGTRGSEYVAAGGIGFAAHHELRKSYKCFDQYRPFYNVAGVGGLKEDSAERLVGTYINLGFTVATGVATLPTEDGDAPPPAAETWRFGHYMRVRDYRTAGTQDAYFNDRGHGAGAAGVDAQVGSYEWSLRDPVWFYYKFLNIFRADTFLQSNVGRLYTQEELDTGGASNMLERWASQDSLLAGYGDSEEYVDQLGYRTQSGSDNIFTSIQAIINHSYGDWLFAGWDADNTMGGGGDGVQQTGGSFFLRMLDSKDSFYNLCEENELIDADGNLDDAALNIYATKFALNFSATVIADLNAWRMTSTQAKTYRLRWCPDYYTSLNDLEGITLGSTTLDANVGQINPYGGDYWALSVNKSKKNYAGEPYDEIYDTYPGNVPPMNRSIANLWTDDPYYYGGGLGKESKFFIGGDWADDTMGYENLNAAGDFDRGFSRADLYLEEKMSSDTSKYDVDLGDGIYPGRYVFSFADYLINKVNVAFEEGGWNIDIMDAVLDIVPLLFDYHGAPVLASGELDKLAAVDVVTQKYGWFFVDMEKYIMQNSHLSRVMNPHNLEAFFTYGKDMINRTIKIDHVIFGRNNGMRRFGYIEESDWADASPLRNTPLKMELHKGSSLDAQPTDDETMTFSSIHNGGGTASVAYPYIPQLNVASWADFTASTESDPHPYTGPGGTSEATSTVVPKTDYATDEGYTGAGATAGYDTSSSETSGETNPGQEKYNQWSYLMQRNYDFAGSAAIPNDYRLACFAYNYYVDDDIATSFTDSNMMQVKICDKSHLIIEKLLSYMEDQYTNYEQYATWAQENCSFNVYDSTFNQFFADKCEEIFMDTDGSLHRAPWYMAAVCVIVLEDIFTGKYGGDYHLALEAAMYISDSINPYTGSLDYVKEIMTRFSEAIAALDAIYGTLIDELEIDTDSSLPDEHKYKYFRVGQAPALAGFTPESTSTPDWQITADLGIIDYAGNPADGGLPTLPDPYAASDTYGHSHDSTVLIP